MKANLTTKYNFQPITLVITMDNMDDLKRITARFNLILPNTIECERNIKKVLNDKLKELNETLTHK